MARDDPPVIVKTFATFRHGTPTKLQPEESSRPPDTHTEITGSGCSATAGLGAETSSATWNARLVVYTQIRPTP